MRSLLVNIFNILCIILLFSILQRTPLQNLSIFLSIFCILVSFLFLNKSYFLKKNIYYVQTRKIHTIFFLLFILSTLATKIFFHQSITDGLAANSNLAEIFIIVFYCYVFSKEKIKVERFEKQFIYFILLNLAVITLFRNYTFNTQSAFSGKNLSFEAKDLPVLFIRFGVVYFFSLLLKKGKAAFGLYAVFLLFYPNLILDFQRGYFAVAIFLMFLSFIFINKVNRAVNQLLIGVSMGIIALLLVLMLNISSDALSKIEQKYSDLFSGLVEGKTSDPAIGYRFFELKVARKHFEKSPVIGVGKIRSINVVKYVGNNYYPADIGIMGVLGTYGVIGVAVFLYLFFLAIKVFIQVHRRASVYSGFTVALSIYAVQIVIESIQTGYIILHPAYFVFLYLLLLYSKTSDESKVEIKADNNSKTITWESPVVFDHRN